MQMFRPSSRLWPVCSPLLALAVVAINCCPARAVVYCTTTGVPAGCIVRPVVKSAVGTPIVDMPHFIFISRQDLFDRRNSNNTRTDWPAPPRQPAQF
jgi:hypothetical protein